MSSMSESRVSRSSSLSMPTHVRNHQQTSSIISNDPKAQLQAKIDFQKVMVGYREDNLKDLIKIKLPTYITRLHIANIKDSHSVNIISVTCKDLDARRVEVTIENDHRTQVPVEMQLARAPEDEDLLCLQEQAKKDLAASLSEQSKAETEAKKSRCVIQ